MIDVSIVITTYNSSENLAKSISSVINNTTKHSIEIIVVDDAPQDIVTPEIVKKYNGVRIIKNPSNLGYVRSNNLGIRNSIGKYVLSLNNDTVIIDGAIDILLDVMANVPGAGAVGPKLLNSDGTIQLQCRRSFPDPMNSFYYFSGLERIFPANERFGSYLMPSNDDRTTQEVDCLCGAAMMVRREVVDSIGMMDEDYFMYGDDIDWCYRIKKAGWKIFYVPEAEIIHYGGRGGSRKQAFRNIFEFHRAMAVFYRKHYSKKYFPVISWLVYSGIWLKFCVASLQNAFRRDKFVGTKKP